MDNRNDIMNNGEHAENVQNINSEENKTAQTEQNASDNTAAAQTASRNQQPQPQGEYSWRNPYYNPETRKVEQPAQSSNDPQPAQQTYSTNGAQNQKKSHGCLWAFIIFIVALAFVSLTLLLIHFLPLLKNIFLK